MTGGNKGGAQRASSLRPRCVGEVDPETATHMYLPMPTYYYEYSIEIFGHIIGDVDEYQL
jgi:hypothetical protein